MRSPHRLLAALASSFLMFLMFLILPAGCAEEGPTCATGEVLDTTTGECVEIDFDAGPMDAGPDPDDGGPDGGGDAGPCGECDPGQHCDEVDGACVACLVDGHCEESDYCDTETHECMTGCRDDGDCPATAPTCAEHVCTENCTTPLCATNHPDAPICDAGTGRCGECSPASEEVDCALDGSACHPDDLVCTGVPRDSLARCEPCASDSECADYLTAEARCVPTYFGTTDVDAGTYCLVDADELDPTSCPDGMQFAEMAESTLGVEARYCFPRQSQTTCAAIRSFVEATSGQCTAASDCGVFDDDGICVGDRCSYPCTQSSDCIGAATCNDGAAPPRCE